MTYLDRILEVLTDEPTSLDDEFLCGPKATYAIQALKRGISQNKIIMVEVDHIKTKYKGHLYYLNQAKTE